MVPISFDIYFKIIGGIGLLSLLPQITSIFKIFDEIEKCKLEIEKQRTIDPHTERPNKFDKEIEDNIKKAGNMKPFINKFMIIFALSVFSSIIYAICKDIPYLSNEIWYSNFISIVSYIFFICIPFYFTISIYRFFNLYYLMIHYSSFKNIYNYKKNETNKKKHFTFR